jgi:hypothetical protein
LIACAIASVTLNCEAGIAGDSYDVIEHIPLFLTFLVVVDISLRCGAVISVRRYDELLALRVLENEAQFEDGAAKSAQTAADIALNEYDAGTVAYTTANL